VIPRNGAVHSRPRSAILFLLAIVLPCAVLAVLTVRLMTTQSELAQKRRADTRRALVASVRAELSSRLERLKLHAVTRSVAVTDRATRENDLVVLVASLVNGRIRLPWTVEAAADDALFGEGAYTEAIRLGERAEHQRGGIGEAVTAYQQALGLAASPVQTAFAQLALARTLQAAGRARDAARQDRQLLRTPLSVRDDAGMPFALYAAHRELARSGPNVDYRAVADVLEICLATDPPLPPMALYTVRDLAERVAQRASDVQFGAGVQQFVRALTATSQEREQALSLQDSLAAILPAATSAAVTEVPWVVFGPKETPWLVSASGGGPSGRAFVVAARLDSFISHMESVPLLRDNGIRLAVSGPVPGAEPLGGILPLAMVLQQPQPDALTNEETLQRRFYVAALLLVIGIAWSGGYFFWQHVRRELRVAEMRSQFVSSVSHELKTPLTSIRMFAETLLLGRASRSDTRHEYLETIVNESERLTRLINNVLEFSKIEQGTKTYRLAPQSLGGIVAAAAKVMEYPLVQEGFELRRNLEPTVPSIPVDRDAIQQAILNLLSNAMKYSGDSRTIELALSSTGREVQISVSDRGYGISETEQRRVFEKFYRSAAREHQHIPGTGLGLTIVEHVAAAHGGSVSVRSQIGHGSTFSIVLPIPAADSSTRVSERALNSAHASHPGH
jgi:signal transduction histidine kinase